MNNLTLPFKKMTRDDITQIFHLGHKAWDIVENSTARGMLYGTPLCAPETSLVLGITNESLEYLTNEGLRNGYGVKLKGLETGLEYLYWHCLPFFPVWGGSTVKRGQIVAYMGNAGNVYSGGIYVPLEERTKDTERGTHLHLEIYRDGQQVDPMGLFNWNWQPTYTIGDYINAFSVVLTKMLRAIK